MKEILFVCSGNTCRSPMAEAIFNYKIENSPKLKELGVHAKSAGTFAIDGAKITPQAEETLENMGITGSSKHRARRFNADLADEVDLILTMQEPHLEEVKVLAPHDEAKAHTLKGFAVGIDGNTGGNEYDIADPYMQSLDVYMETAKSIEEAIDGVMARLEKDWAGA